jgi:hypothetical protein
MTRMIMGCLVFSVLIACGRSDQASSTGSGTSDPTSGMMWLTGPSPTHPPTSTPYIPPVHGNVVELDTTKAGNRSHLDISMQPDQLLHLTASIDGLPYFEWFTDIDPRLFEITMDGQPHTPVYGYEAYPSGGLMLTPLYTGTNPITIQLRLDLCANCDTVSTYTVYSITVD